MSLDATNWAWRIKFPDRKGGSLKPLKKLVLLSLADRAGEDHTCYPSMQRLEQDTGLDRKTILKIISELLADHLIQDTGERKGVTKRVKVYKLLGVTGRETVPTTEPFNNQKAPETVPSMEQSQQWNDSNNGMLNSPNSGTLNSPNNGTQNLPKNLPIESKNKKTWLDLKTLMDELDLITTPEIAKEIKTASWFIREKRAFEIYNTDKNLCDELLNYHFADWLLNAHAKYQNRNQHAAQNKTSQTAKPKKFSDKQINLFAQKLAHHPEVSSKFAEAGESYEQLTARIAKKLTNPTEAKNFEKYLRELGFEGQLGEVA